VYSTRLMQMLSSYTTNAVVHLRLSSASAQRRHSASLHTHVESSFLYTEPPAAIVVESKRVNSSPMCATIVLILVSKPSILSSVSLCAARSEPN
jgi:hypothetical protein